MGRVDDSFNESIDSFVDILTTGFNIGLSSEEVVSFYTYLCKEYKRENGSCLDAPDYDVHWRARTKYIEQEFDKHFNHLQRMRT